MYSPTASIFPMGIKMQLVPELQDMTNSKTKTNAIQCQALQAKFMAHTKTSWIRQEVSDKTYTQLQLYETLWAMRLPRWQANQSAQPMFHAISPRATEDGYLVHYLPQYTTQVRVAITQLSEQHPSRIITPAIMTQPMPALTKLTNTSKPRAPHQQAEQKPIRLRIHMFNCFGLPLSSQPYNTSTEPNSYTTDNSASHHQLCCWLLALRQLFQNTAWDKWWYRNSIQATEKDKTLPASSNNTHPQSFPNS